MELLFKSQGIWAMIGVVLMFSELLLPGLVSIFLGVAAIIVSIGLHFEIIHGLMQSFTTWFITSLLLLVTLRQALAKFLPGDTDIIKNDDDIDAIGQVVGVTVDIEEENTNGRIRYQGTDWPARSDFGKIEAGSKAQIKYRENISWVVEKYLESN